MDRRINFADIIEEKIDENLFLDSWKKLQYGIMYLLVDRII